MVYRVDYYIQMNIAGRWFSVTPELDLKGVENWKGTIKAYSNKYRVIKITKEVVEELEYESKMQDN